jgi:hypothetical protein
MNSSVEIRHHNDIPWYDAPIPRRWHKCKPQTWGWIEFTYVERCACGAINMPTIADPHPYWLDRNSRRPDKRRVHK